MLLAYATGQFSSVLSLLLVLASCWRFAASECVRTSRTRKGCADSQSRRHRVSTQSSMHDSQYRESKIASPSLTTAQAPSKKKIGKIIKDLVVAQLHHPTTSSEKERQVIIKPALPAGWRAFSAFCFSMERYMIMAIGTKTKRMGRIHLAASV